MDTTTTPETPATASTLLEDITRLFKRFAPAGGSVDGFVQGRRQDVDALLAVGRIASDGTAEAVDKQLDTLRAVGEELRAVLIRPADAEGTRADSIREAARRAVAGYADLAQVVLTAQGEAFATVSQRAHADVLELKNLLSPKA